MDSVTSLPVFRRRHGADSLLCILIFAFFLISEATSIGCFVCNSVKHSEPGCEDTFNNTNGFYVRDCKAGRPKRAGLFPATACIKMKAEMTSGVQLVVRQCVVDNGGVNTETEIGRSDHCNYVNTIKYNGDSMHGCVLSCNTDGCNAAHPTFRPRHPPLLSLLSALVAISVLR